MFNNKNSFKYFLNFGSLSHFLILWGRLLKTVIPKLSGDFMVIFKRLKGTLSSDFDF